MKNDGKAAAARAGTESDALVSQFSNWVEQGTESFFAAQRILLDLVVRQNTMAMTVLRSRISDMKPATEAISGAAEEGLANFVAAQRIFLELSKHQTEIVMTGVKERVGASTPAGIMADLLKRSVDTFIDLQEHFLTTAGKQSKAWVESVQTGQPFAGLGLGELTREGIENLVDAQTKFLKIVAEETAKAVRAPKPAAKPSKQPEFAELTRRSVDAFIEAQKKLLGTGGKQLDTNIEAAGKAAKTLAGAPAATLGQLTRGGIDNFVAAQKALLEVMAKPGKPQGKAAAKQHAAPAHAHAH